MLILELIKFIGVAIVTGLAITVCLQLGTKLINSFKKKKVNVKIN